MSKVSLRVSLCLCLSLVFAASGHTATFLVTSENDSGTGSLRKALTDVNNSDGGDSIIISANLTIQPLTPLPVIERNGTSIVGFGPHVTLDGSLLPDSSTEPALTVESRNCEIGNISIINFPEDGILLLGDDNTVSECLIGNDGVTAMPNGGAGIVVKGSNNHIGIGVYTGRNVISGNGREGIMVNRNGTVSPTGTVIAGNHIGTNEDGTAAIPNGLRGIHCYLCSGMTVGGTGAEDGNLISGNDFEGIRIQNAANLATPFIILGNVIGLNRDGTAALGNTGRGIIAETPTEINIGSLILNGSNVISGNGNDGILLRSGRGHAPHFIQGNLIGTSADANQPIPNDGDGIVLETNEATVNFNLISGNLENGLKIFGEESAARQNHVVQSNLIGTNTNGDNLGNGETGITFLDVANANLVGGEDSQANVIAFNDLGIYAEGIGVTNTFRRNSIYGNANGGIDLGTFGNDSKAAPLLTGLSASGEIQGTAADGDTIDIFVDTGDQGETYLESITLNGTASFMGTVNLNVYAGQFVTATATDADGNTSEFSSPLLIPAEGEGEGEGEVEGELGTTHAADQNGDGTLDFGELLRIIQLYNSGALSCATVTMEDGYQPGMGDTSCNPHTSDYAPVDWSITLSELLRAIQLFQASPIVPCQQGEDGFCPAS